MYRLVVDIKGKIDACPGVLETRMTTSGLVTSEKVQAIGYRTAKS